MSRIIVAIPKRETGIQIRNLLVRNGFDVIGVCTSGVQILNYADVLEEGIVLPAQRYGVWRITSGFAAVI